MSNLLPGIEPDMQRGAVFSHDQRYRWVLTRTFDGTKGMVNFIMLNPSTADAELDDPTIRRCIGFARDLGFGQLIVTNLFAIRATDPRVIKVTEDPVGKESNDGYIKATALRAKMIICAWGNHGRFGGRADEVLGMLAGIGMLEKCHALRVSAGGHPCHPLYLPSDLKPVRFNGGLE